MPDSQKTIEILLQFKQAGEEIVQASQEALEKLQFITMSLGGDVNDALSMPGAEEAQSKIDAVTGAVGGLNSSLEGTAVESKASQAALQALAESAASGLNTATASAEALTAALQQTQQAAGTSGASSIQSLNSALGRSSELGGTLRLLAGSGPILALGLLASKFAEVSKEADRLSIELRKGEIGWAEFVEGILLKIPVVGQISQGIIDIQDAITGVGYANEVAAEKAKKSAEAWKETAAVIKDAATAVQEAHREASEMIQKFNDQGQDATQKAGADPVQSAIDQQYAAEDGRRRDIYNTFDQRRKQAGVDKLPDLQQQLSNPLANLGQVQAEINKIQDAYKSIAKDEEDAIKASDDLTDKAIAGIRNAASAAFASDEIKKLAEEFKSSWDDAQKIVDGISSKIEAEDARLMQERSELIKNAHTPQQKYDAGLEQLDQLNRYSPLPPGIYDQEKAKLQKALDDETAAVAKALDEKKLKQDEYNAAIQTGVNKQIADAQTSYDRDVASWHDALLKKEITQDQFNQYVVDRTSQMNEDLYQIQLQKRQAGQDVQLAGLQANHDGLGAQNLQIQMDYEKQVEQLRQQYQVQGLLSEQQYNDAILALDKSTEEKRLLVNGSFVDGVQIGFEKLQENIQSQAQIGEQVAADFANGFGDAFGQIVTGTKSVGDAFRDMAASILGNIAKLEAQSAFNAVLAPILAGVNATIGGAFSSLFSGPNFATSSNAFSGGPSEVPMPFASVPMANAGGFIARFAQGDMVGGGPWGPDRDSVPALLTPGEFVVRRSAVSMPGVLGMLRNLNAGMPAMNAARSAAASLGRSSAARSSAAGGGGAAGGSSAPVVMPAVVANDVNMRALVNGGRNAMLDFLRTNYQHYAPRGGR